jgi:hypothetical protein
MAITVQRRYGDAATTDSGQGTTTDELLATEIHYLVQGTDSELLAIQAVRSAAPTTWNDLERGEVTVELLPDTTTFWDAAVRYSAPDQELEVGESSYSFDTGGGTQHITQALAHVASYAPAGKTAPDFKGAIGVTSDGVEGVDITVPVYNFSETHILANSVVTNAYKGKLTALAGKTNNATFKGFAIGECLFLGASGSKRGKGDWEISFSFAASKNRTSLTVGDISGIAKKGWEYLWVRYEDAVDATAKALVKKPLAVYIEKVYDEGNFADLGIGTT